MTTTIRLIAAAAALCASAALPVHAEGYGKGISADATTNVQRGATATSNSGQLASAASVGSTTREAKREEAIVALRRGEIPSGERSSRPTM